MPERAQLLFRTEKTTRGHMFRDELVFFDDDRDKQRMPGGFRLADVPGETRIGHAAK